MKITKEFLLDFIEKNKNDFEFKYFGDVLGCCPKNIEESNNECLFNFNLNNNSLSMYLSYNMITNTNPFYNTVEFSYYRIIPTIEIFNETIQIYKAFEKSAVLFMKNFKIEMKKLKIEDDFLND